VKGITIYPSFKPAANKIVDKTNVNSKILGNTRKCSIYYPPSYFDNPYKKYEVLLLHDGQNLFDPKQAAFGTSWLVQDTINEQTSQGAMREIVVVGIWNTADRINEYTYSYDPT
jgi:predicted alpha/beta superfamily hydrolase